MNELDPKIIDIFYDRHICKMLGIVYNPKDGIFSEKDKEKALEYILSLQKKEQ